MRRRITAGWTWQKRPTATRFRAIHSAGEVVPEGVRRFGPGFSSLGALAIVELDEPGVGERALPIAGPGPDVGPFIEQDPGNQSILPRRCFPDLVGALSITRGLT